MIKERIYRTLSKDPLFARSPMESAEPLMEKRKKAFLRLRRILEYEFYTQQEFMENPVIAMTTQHCIGSFDWSITVKKTIGLDMVTNSVRSLGTRRHAKFNEDIMSFEAMGCFALTEIRSACKIHYFNYTFRIFDHVLS